jgi:hypothetical protein
MGLQVWLERKQVWCIELGENWTNKILNFPWNFNASSINNHFVEKVWSLNMLQKLWCELWTLFDLIDLISANFNLFCWTLMLNMGTSCTIQKYDGWVLGQCWNVFLALRLEIEMLMNDKGKVVTELSDKRWPCNLALLCDISHHVNDLNTKLQGK